MRYLLLLAVLLAFLLPLAPVFAQGCLTHPEGLTLPATYVSMSTARLNGYIVEDGSGNGTGNVSARFEYRMNNITLYQTPWVSEFQTGDYVYADVTGLQANTTYYYIIEMQNSCGYATGNCTGNGTGAGVSYPYLSGVGGFPVGNTTWLIAPSGCSFTTTSSVLDVSMFLAIPQAAEATIDLKWQKPVGATEVIVRYKKNYYPSSPSDGTLVCQTIMNTYSLTGLTPGDTLYFSAWGVSGGNYSATAANAIATVSLVHSIDFPTLPAQPSSWFLGVQYTNMSGMPFYSVINAVADKFGFNRQFFWASLGFMIALLVFLGAYRATQGRVMVSLLAATVAMGIETKMGLMAGFMIFIMLILSFTSWQLERRA